MVLLEILSAALIALYAMIGGAFINAAITSPENMRKLLVSGWQTVFQFLIFGAIFVLAAIAFGLLAWPRSDPAMHLLMWLAVAHLALYGVFRGCRMIVEILLGDGDSEHDKDQDKVEPDDP